MRCLAAIGLSGCLFLLAPLASAQEPPLPPPTPPASAAPATSSPAPSPGRSRYAHCALDRRAGIDDDDAESVESFVCHEVEAKLQPTGKYRVRVGKLGARLILTILALDESGAIREDKQLVLTSLDEVPVAAPRLVESMADRKPVSETQDVTNIVAAESRVPKKRSSEVHAILGMIGIGRVGEKNGTGAGAVVGLSAGSATWAFIGDLRLAGGEAKQIALGGGIRHWFGTSDTAPFLGAGLALENTGAGKRGGSGLALYGEVGIEIMRTHQVGGSFGLRIDQPTFAEEHGDDHVGPTIGTCIAMRF